MSHKNKSEMAACAQICMECTRACGEAICACLTRTNISIDRELIECLIDCMSICQAGISLLMRSSPNHTITCQAVTEITSRCAQHCEKFDDPILTYCAEECRGCAESCRAMTDGKTVKCDLSDEI